MRARGYRGGLFRRRLHRRHGALSIVLLVVTLSLAGTLAYHAQDAARSHRQTAENALRDYAGVAAWLYATRSRDVLGGSLWSVFEPARELSRVSRTSPLPPTDLLRPRRSGHRFNPHTYFRLDFGDGSLTATGEVSAARLAWLGDSIRAYHVDHPRSDWRLVAANDGDLATEVAGFFIVRDRRRDARAAYGFIAKKEELGHLFTSCSREDLIPPALAREQPTDSLLYLRVSDAASTAIFESPIRYDTTFAAADTLGRQYAGLVVQAAIRPNAAENLIIGGLPRSRLPLILGLLLLTVGVGFATMLQFRREQQLARLRDDFVSGVSHELRTPLAQIRMFGELLDEGKLRTTEERKRSATVINREARRLTHLVENILHFSRLRRSAPSLRFEMTDVRTVIGETVEAFAPLAMARDVHLRERIEDELLVRSDRDALSQILLNLLDNALKYGPAGQTVTVGLAAAGDQARLFVEDEGPGIPRSHRNEIWESYRRLDRDANTTVGGSGIGLAVVSELAGLHGGRAWVEDAPGGGARFVVELPHAVPKAGTSESRSAVAADSTARAIT